MPPGGMPKPSLDGAREPMSADRSVTPNGIPGFDPSLGHPLGYAFSLTQYACHGIRDARNRPNTPRNFVNSLGISQFTRNRFHPELTP